MIKKLVLFLFSITTGLALAQSTTVSVTVVDSSSQVWANGTISYTFLGNGSYSGPYQWQNANLPNIYLQPTVVALDGTGSASFTIPTSTTISPSGSSWAITVCPNATVPVCQTVNIPTSGSTQNISSQVTAVIGTISVAAATIPKGGSCLWRVLL